MTRQRPIRKYLIRGLLGIVLAGGLGFGATAGWKHIASRPCTFVNLQGVQYADREALESMIRDTMDAHLVADRLRRHPWVRATSAVCYPTGMLHVWVEERVPQAVMISNDGLPAHYIDRAGYMMPVDTVAGFDVPLIYDAQVGYRPLEPVDHAGLRMLVHMLPTLDASIDSLISEFIFSGDELELITRPAPAGTAARVNLGSQQWESRLKRLETFWKQRVVDHPEPHYRVIDLRFEGQIVTQETST